MNDKVEEFLDGLRAGEPKAVDAANRLLGTMARTHAPTELSERQEQILGLLARGLSDKEVGAELEIATYTVREHVRRAKAILGARTRVHTVVLWVAREALTPPGSNGVRTRV